MKKIYWQLPFLLFLIVGTVLIVRNQQSIPYQQNSGTVFGTFYNISYQSDQDLGDDIVALLDSIDNSLSPFNDHSVITKINNNEPVALNAMFMDVFRLAEAVSKETSGAFDITVAPLVNAWGFGFKTGQHPGQADIDSLRQLVGYAKVKEQNGRIVKQDARIMLDCSAIAKGYAADCVARLIRSNEIENFMVEIGGEVVTRGLNPKRLPWRIGVTKPSEDSLSVAQEIQTVLNITDVAMATSGNYRNFYYRDGKKYAHTIDPFTGQPVQHSLLSATVITDNCATADAYATAFMVMGMEKAKKVLDSHKELQAYFIYAEDNGDNGVWFSPELRKRIEN